MKPIGCHGILVLAQVCDDIMSMCASFCFCIGSLRRAGPARRNEPMVELLTPSTKKVIVKKLRRGSLSKLHFEAGSTLNLVRAFGQTHGGPLVENTVLPGNCTGIQYK